jgi:hypothetical protein
LSAKPDGRYHAQSKGERLMKKMNLALMASILLALPACGGDDGDDGGTTNPSTTNDGTTTGQTSSDPTTSDPTTNDPTTNDPTTNDPTTNDPTTNDPTTNDESSSTGDDPTDGEDDTTGGEKTACEDFCERFFATCGELNANDYGTEDDCVSTCSGLSEEDFDFTCRQTHLTNAENGQNPGEVATHCGHANLNGGGQCNTVGG